MSTWTTQDGRTVEIKWMQSSHLVHSFNMILRKNGLNRDHVKKYEHHAVLGPMISELKRRRLYTWQPDDQLKPIKMRETPAQLCMLRALLDVLPAPDVKPIEAFYKDPQGAIEQMLANPHQNARLLARFTSYRLDPKCLD